MQVSCTCNLQKYVKIAFFHQSRSCVFLHASGILMCYFLTFWGSFLWHPAHLSVSERLQSNGSFLPVCWVWGSLLKTLEARSVSEYIRWILLVRSLDLCFRHLNRSDLIFIGVLQQCLSLLGSLLCISSFSKFMFRNLSWVSFECFAT